MRKEKITSVLFWKPKFQRDRTTSTVSNAERAETVTNGSGLLRLTTRRPPVSWIETVPV